MQTVTSHSNNNHRNTKPRFQPRPPKAAIVCCIYKLMHVHLQTSVPEGQRPIPFNSPACSSSSFTHGSSPSACIASLKSCTATWPVNSTAISFTELSAWCNPFSEDMAFTARRSSVCAAGHWGSICTARRSAEAEALSKTAHRHIKTPASLLYPDLPSACVKADAHPVLPWLQLTQVACQSYSSTDIPDVLVMITTPLHRACRPHVMLAYCLHSRVAASSYQSSHPCTSKTILIRPCRHTTQGDQLELLDTWS